MVDPQSPAPTPSPSPGTAIRTPFKPLIFGEALFDQFPDGSRVLGGAPFNVAWHLRGFKANPLLLSAIGKDRAGEKILRRMGEWGMDTEGVQLHPTRPTGLVKADVKDGEARFHIRSRQAYDAMAAEKLPPPPRLQEAHLLYHGTLALREETTRLTWEYLRGMLDVPVLVDVNLRDPWWNREILQHVLHGADWVKMNEVEFGLFSDTRPQREEEWEEAAAAFRDSYTIHNLILTFGPRGAMGLGPEEAFWQEAPPVETVADTVGAGDAFSAVTALGAHSGWPLGTLLRRAAALAADLCTLRGATTRDPELYQRHLRSWSHES